MDFNAVKTARVVSYILYILQSSVASSSGLPDLSILNHIPILF